MSRTAEGDKTNRKDKENLKSQNKEQHRGGVHVAIDESNASQQALLWESYALTVLRALLCLVCSGWVTVQVITKGARGEDES
jgi:hypothetical protein